MPASAPNKYSMVASFKFPMASFTVSASDFHRLHLTRNALYGSTGSSRGGAQDHCMKGQAGGRQEGIVSGSAVCVLGGQRCLQAQ